MCLHPKIWDHSPTVIENCFDYSTGPIDHEILRCEYVECCTIKDVCLRIMQLNIRGLISKQSDLRRLFLENQVDIGLICESWLTALNECKLDINGYNYVGKIKSNRKGGGTCILVKENIMFREIKRINNCTLEYCAIEVKTDAGTLIVCSAYKPPNSDNKVFLEDYGNLLKYFKTLKSQGIIIGLDHNLDLLKHTSHSITQTFLDTNFDDALLPVINKPTRITKNSATLIDNIFVSSNLDCGRSMIIYDDLSDHLPCVMDVNNLMTTKVESRMSWKKMFNTKNIDKLCKQSPNKIGTKSCNI